MSRKQFCAICAWREHCAKKFSIPDGGERCPDFSRDVSIKDAQEESTDKSAKPQENV